MPASAKTLSIIVPVHNEEAAIKPFLERTETVLKSIKFGGVKIKWECIFIDDGSTDSTYDVLKEMQGKNVAVKVINLSRNFGKEHALTAGIHHASGDAVIPMDVDLQDPPELIEDMAKHWQEGAEVVLATRKRRDEDTFFKRGFAMLFYRLIGKLSTIKIPENTGDFRLMDRKVVDVLNTMHERTRFMKGLFAWPGFKTEQVFYDRPAREVGETSWSLRKLFALAMDGIFSFTTLPLRVWTYLGLFISLGAFSYAMFIIFQTLVAGVDVPGYASLMTVVLFMGGVQLISLGVIGEYISRIYRETKQRPIYVVREKIGFGNEDSAHD